MSDKTIQNTTVGTVQPGALTAIARKEDFLQHLQDFLDTHKTEKWCVAAIDVEHFRLYNELYGTEQGNTLLNTLASHLLDYQKTSGCPVGYWGNDDFFLCLPDDRVQQQDIVITLQTCVSPNHQDVTFFLALGLCPVSEHPEADAATLCNYAQIAVMNPDHSGSGIHRFAPAMLDSLKAQQQLLSELEHALDNHEFTFFLQPKCNSMTRAIVGMEALVRWNHPTRGCVQPSEFMPLLESTGLISRLDQYIWEAVCQTLQKWQASDSNLVPVSVNVSVVDIVNLDVPQIFSDLVEKYQLEPKLLLAEITETMLAENSSVVENAILHGIKPKVGGGTVSLKLEELPDHWQVTVTDDGVGFGLEAVREKGSIGLENVRRRIARFPGSELRITSTVGMGTQAVLTYGKRGKNMENLSKST